jgi:PAS domain S-box-containing protein
MSEYVVSDEIARLAVDACPCGMIMTDARGKIILVNAEAERLFGYARDELFGKSVDILVPLAARANHAKLRADFNMRPQARRMGIGRDLYGLRSDGTQIPIEIGLNPIRTSDGVMILSAFTDVTQRKLAEERFRLVVEGSPIAEIMTSETDRIVLVNAEAERLFGYLRDELLGKPFEMLVSGQIRNGNVYPRDSLQIHAEPRSPRADEELYIVRKDGTELAVEIGLNPIRTAEGKMLLRAVIDISKRKQAIQALAAQSEELRRSNADLEQFAYVASHDLQEPLRMVSSYTELLAEYHKEKLDDKAEKYINYVVGGAKRMQQLVNDLLTYSRVDTQGKPPTRVQSESVVRSVLDDFKVEIEKSGATIVCDQLPVVSVDKIQLAQLFQNLIGNSLKFRGERAPKIRISAERDNNQWMFRIEDNGIGIDKQYAEHVFQMFQRLHERGRYEGSGIGLAIAKKIVERHGGLIWFESEPEKGCTFYFTIPIPQETPV